MTREKAGKERGRVNLIKLYYTLQNQKSSYNYRKIGRVKLKTLVKNQIARALIFDNCRATVKSLLILAFPAESGNISLPNVSTYFLCVPEPDLSHS